MGRSCHEFDTYRLDGTVQSCRLDRTVPSYKRYAESVSNPATTNPRRSPAKREAILAAATDVFLREGYARASVDAIAAAAGVGKQTIYGHFGDKERLFLAVVEDARGSVGAGAHAEADLVIDTGDPKADLQGAAKHLLRAITAPQVSALHRLTIAESAHHPQLQQSWRDDGATQAVIDIVAGYLTNLGERGLLDVPTPELTARQWLMLLTAEAQVRSLRGLQPLSELALADIAEETTDLILRACRPLK